MYKKKKHLKKDPHLAEGFIFLLKYFSVSAADNQKHTNLYLTAMG